MRRIIPIALAAALSLAACGTPPTQRVSQPTQAPAATQIPATDAPVPTLEPTTVYTPVPTQDLQSYLLTQAYSAFTPQASATPLTTEVAPTVAATARPASGGPAPTATPVTPTAVPVLYPAETVQIPNAYNTAQCEIRNFGDCTVTMSSGVTVDLTYTFDVAGNQFTFGDAAVVTTKDGKQYAWSQSGNSLVKPPDFTKDESWVLNGGQQAEFHTGLENLQPGHYTARLYICTGTPQQCSAGQGWTNVGGQVVNFTISS
jgi:hypothetical protein